jgi:hypothetical protein
MGGVGRPMLAFSRLRRWAKVASPNRTGSIVEFDSELGGKPVLVPGSRHDHPLQ